MLAAEFSTKDNMSKKNKAKFKKQIKAQILEEMARVQTQAPVAAPVVPSILPTPMIKSDTPTAVPTQPTADNSTIQNLLQIKYDLKKTAIVIGILALIIVALVILDQKYSILLSFGNVLFKVFHIQ